MCRLCNFANQQKAPEYWMYLQSPPSGAQKSDAQKKIEAPSRDFGHGLGMELAC